MEEREGEPHWVPVQKLRIARRYYNGNCKKTRAVECVEHNEELMIRL